MFDGEVTVTVINSHRDGDFGVMVGVVSHGEVSSAFMHKNEVLHLADALKAAAEQIGGADTEDDSPRQAFGVRS
jgi:hypothetical protein